HLSNLSQTAFLQLCQLLRQVRLYLDMSSGITLSNSLITSRLDYCNSLFFNLPVNSINRLQRIQNSIVRVFLPNFKRSDHISPALYQLHWLPVHHRITCKIALLTYKTLCANQPSYL